MVAFCEFSFTFTGIDTPLWAQLMVRYAPGMTLAVVTKKAVMSLTITTEEAFMVSMNNIRIQPATVVTMTTGRVFNAGFFYKALPEFVPCDRVDVALRCLAGEIAHTARYLHDGKEAPVNNTAAIPMKKIKELLNMVHAAEPIDRCYYSPTDQQVHIQFKAGAHLTLYEDRYTNGGKVLFDIDDGFLGDNATTDMKREFDAWNYNEDIEVLHNAWPVGG